MADLERPVTRRELQEELAAMTAELRARFEGYFSIAGGCQLSTTVTGETVVSSVGTLTRNRCPSGATS
jgi:hypothetical protein